MASALNSGSKRKARESAVREALLELIETRIVLRFGKEMGEQIMLEIKQIKDVKTLNFLKKIIVVVNDAEELLGLLKVLKR